MVAGRKASNPLATEPCPVPASPSDPERLSILLALPWVLLWLGCSLLSSPSLGN